MRCLLLLVYAVGCAAVEPGELEVRLITDLVPGAEFEAIEVSLSGPGHVDMVRSVVPMAHDFTIPGGVVVAELATISGVHELELRLLNRSDQMVAVRRATTWIRGFSRATLIVSRPEFVAPAMPAPEPAPEVVVGAVIPWSPSTAEEEPAQPVLSCGQAGEICCEDFACAEGLGCEAGRCRAFGFFDALPSCLASAYTTCDRCVCNSCAELEARCRFETRCGEILECARTEQCLGLDCMDICFNILEVGSDAVSIAAELSNCTQNNCLDHCSS